MDELVHGYVFSQHALAEMTRRGIGLDTVAKIIAAPEQRSAIRLGREVLQSRVLVDGKSYLVRVFVDVDRNRPKL